MRIPLFRLFTAALLGSGLAGSPALAQSVVANPGFEDGTPGQVPPGWRAGARGYPAAIDAELPHSGAQAVRLEREDTTTAEFGTLVQGVDAAPYRGQRVRLRGWVRVAPGRAQTEGAGLWLRVDRDDGTMGFFDNMRDRPIRSALWQPYEIIGDVADDAASIVFGLLLGGAGTAWLDDVSLEILGPTPVLAPEAPRPLEARGRANLVAFARLLGYVRYFHPSDQAAALDWDRFAIEGVRAVEGAPGADALADSLRQLFGPIAPSMEIRTSAAGTPAGTEVEGTQLVAWRHLGVGTGTERSIYRSTRLRAPAGTRPDSFPDPAQPFQADLGGGVRALVPLAVFADSAGTLPRGSGPALRGLPSPTRGGVGSADDRATRLAAVVLAWNVFQHFYPYFDVVDADWSAELVRALPSAATDTDADAFLATLRRMVAALHDGHGGVYPVGSPLRVPPLVWEWIEDRLVVTAVADSVDEVGPGDVVLAIDGRPTLERVKETEALTSSATPQWRRYRALRTLLTGPPGSQLQLVLLRADGSTDTLVVTRSAPTPPAEPRPEPVAEVRPGIWYVDFDRVTDEQVSEALPALAGARGLIFDMRGYPRRVNAALLLSHLLTEPGTSAQWHVPVVTRPDREDMRFHRAGEWNLVPRQPHLAAPRIFLTDGRAVSYAESVMGIVEHYRLGEILGATTAGTNGNVNPFTVPGGFSISWTGMKVLKHDGSRHHGVGIAPTVPLERTISGVRAGRDELLEAAIARLDRSTH